MVQIIENEGSLAGRIGKGFGKGLAEQLPEEIKRHRLSSGLEKLNKEGANLSPLQQTAGLIKSGFSPAEVSSFLPVLRESQQTAAFREKYKKPEGETQSSAAPKTGQAVVLQPQEKRGVFASPSQIKAYKANVQQTPSNEETNQLANTYIEQGLAQNVGQAREMADRELRQNLQAQTQKLNDFKTGLNERLKLQLQKGGLGDFQDISGEIQKKLVDEGENRVGSEGKTPQQVDQEMGDIAYELAQTATKAKTTADLWGKTSNKIPNLKDQRKVYEKYGLENEFDKLVTGQLKITPMKAASFLDPLENKEVQKEIKKAIPLWKNAKFGEGNKASQKNLDAIIKNIKPKDNILSIEHELRRNNIDVNQFKQRLSQLEDQRDVVLTPLQVEQRDTPVSNSILGDFLFETIGYS